LEAIPHSASAAEVEHPIAKLSGMIEVRLSALINSYVLKDCLFNSSTCATERSSGNSLTISLEEGMRKKLNAKGVNSKRCGVLRFASHRRI
jgi:hypothetical protein